MCAMNVTVNEITKLTVLVLAFQ